MSNDTSGVMRNGIGTVILEPRRGDGIHRRIVYKSFAKRLRELAFRTDILEFIALFLLGTGRVGIGNADIPERIFGEHDAEGRTDSRLQGFARFQDFDIQLFVCRKRGIQHDAVKDNPLRSKGIKRKGNRRGLLRHSSDCRQQNDNANLKLQTKSRILIKNSK